MEELEKHESTENLDVSAPEETSNTSADTTAETADTPAVPETPALPETPKAPVKRKKHKKRLRKWVKVTLGVMAAAALACGGYRVAILTHNSELASTATMTPSASAEASASVVPTASSAPIASEIDVTASTADSEIAAADAKSLPLGNRGRLYIGDWSVQLNGDDNNDASALQTAADEPDSASYAEYNGKVMISDHANQGFSCIKALSAGDKITLRDADGNESTLVVVASYPDSYYKDGYAMLPDGTDAWKTQDGEYILQTNGDENGDALYIVTCKVEEPEETADAEASASPSASASADASASAEAE